MSVDNRLTEATARAYRYRWVIMGVLWSAYIVVFMYRLGIGPLGPFLKEDMGLTSTEIGSLMSAASLGYMLSIIPTGWAVDRIGVRWLLLIGEVTGGVFLVIMFVAPSYQAALGIMAMSGFGSGCLMPTSAKAVMVWFPAKERATVMGLKQTGVNIGGMIAAAVLPGVALALGWRFGFLLLGILAIAIGVISFILYKNPPAPVVAPSLAASTHIDTPSIGKSLRELLKSRDIWLVTFAGFALALVEFAIIAHLVLYLTEALFFSVVAAGAILAMTQAGGIIAKPGAGLLSDRFFGGSRKKVFMLWNIITTVMCILITAWGNSLSWAIYPVLFILGLTAIGWGGVQVTLVAELAGTELVGRATAISGMIINAGSIVGPMLFGYLVDRLDSYQPAWLAITIFAAVSVAALFFVRENERRT